MKFLLIIFLFCIGFYLPEYASKRPLEPPASGGILKVNESEIREGFANKVISRITPDTHTIKLNVGGGLIREAKKLGNHIERRGLHTLVGNGDMCASACIPIFASGHYRLATKGALFGVHKTTVENRQYNDAYCAYIQRLYKGAAKSWLCTLLLTVPSNELLTLSGETMYKHTGLITKIVK